MHREMKLILESEFNKEREKDRGAITNEVGNALTAIEIEVHKKLKRLLAGETIAEINPEMKDDRISYSPVEFNT